MLLTPSLVGNTRFRLARTEKKEDLYSGSVGVGRREFQGISSPRGEPESGINSRDERGK